MLPSYIPVVRKRAPLRERTILNEPHPGDLSWAKGVGLTEFGPVPVEWKKEGRGSLTFSFEVPESTEAVVRLPRQGINNILTVNGQEIPFSDSGRYIEFIARAGKYSGTVKTSDPSF